MKVPITILSRCQRFDFLGISLPRIVERLREVVAAEGLQADDNALELVARRAGGSMRDAQSLLDQLLAFSGDRLTVEQIHRMLGTAQDDRVVELAASVLNHDAARVLELVAAAAQEGLQLGELLDQMTDYWRDLMVAHCAGEKALDLSVSSRHREALVKQAAALKLDTILAGLDILATAKSRWRTSSHGRVLLEMALIRLGRLEHLVSLSQLSQALTHPMPSAAPAVARPGSSFPANPPRTLADGVAEAAKKKELNAAEAASGPLTAENVTHAWPEILRQVGPILARHLEKADVPAIVGPNSLVLRFGVGYNSEQSYCQQPSTVTRLEETLRKVTGQPWSVRIDAAGGELPPTVAPPPGDIGGPQRRSRKKWQEVVEEIPLVKRAFDVLGAQPVGEIDEAFGAGRAVESPETQES